MELVDHKSFETIFEWLREHPSAAAAIINFRKTYVDVRDPFQSPDHGRLGNGVPGIEDERKDGKTSERLRGRRCCERSGQSTEESFHRESHGEDNQQEKAIKLIQ